MFLLAYHVVIIVVVFLLLLFAMFLCCCYLCVCDNNPHGGPNVLFLVPVGAPITNAVVCVILSVGWCI